MSGNRWIGFMNGYHLLAWPGGTTFRVLTLLAFVTATRCHTYLLGAENLPPVVRLAQTHPSYEFFVTHSVGSGLETRIALSALVRVTDEDASALFLNDEGAPLFFVGNGYLVACNRQNHPVLYRGCFVDLAFTDDQLFDRPLRLVAERPAEAKFATMCLDLFRRVSATGERSEDTQTVVQPTALAGSKATVRDVERVDEVAELFRWPVSGFTLVGQDKDVISFVGISPFARNHLCLSLDGLPAALHASVTRAISFRSAISDGQTYLAPEELTSRLDPSANLATAVITCSGCSLVAPAAVKYVIAAKGHADTRTELLQRWRWYLYARSSAYQRLGNLNALMTAKCLVVPGTPRATQVQMEAAIGADLYSRVRQRLLKDIIADKFENDNETRKALVLMLESGMLLDKPTREALLSAGSHKRMLEDWATLGAAFGTLIPAEITPKLKKISESSNSDELERCLALGLLPVPNAGDSALAAEIVKGIGRKSGDEFIDDFTCKYAIWALAKSTAGRTTLFQGNNAVESSNLLTKYLALDQTSFELAISPSLKAEQNAATSDDFVLWPSDMSPAAPFLRACYDVHVSGRFDEQWPDLLEKARTDPTDKIAVQLVIRCNPDGKDCEALSEIVGEEAWKTPRTLVGNSLTEIIWPEWLARALLIRGDEEAVSREIDRCFQLTTDTRPNRWPPISQLCRSVRLYGSAANRKFLFDLLRPRIVEGDWLDCACATSILESLVGVPLADVPDAIRGGTGPSGITTKIGQAETTAWWQQNHATVRESLQKFEPTW
jgi:hypothetical protein